MPKPKAKRARSTPADTPVDRVLRVIELAGELGRITVPEVMEVIGIPRATAHRIVSHLEEAGYLQKLPAKGAYGAAPKLIGLATNILGSTIVYAPIQMALSDLSRRTGETVSLAMMAAGEITYIASAIGSSPLTLQFEAGQRTPLYCTSSGRIFLPNLDEKSLQEFLATGPWQPATPRTITDPTKLREELLRIKSEGYALNDSELIMGVVGVAVAVRTSEDRLLAALTISAPSARKSIDNLKALVPALRASAARIAKVLEGQS